MKFTRLQTLIRVQIAAASFLLVLALFDSLSAQHLGYYGRLDHFYAEEITRFNRNFEEHIKQLDRCLEEMDRFEKGEILLEPVECPKENKMRPKVSDLLEEAKLVMMSYQKTLDDALRRHLEVGAPLPTFEKTDEAKSEAMALMDIYKVKFQQAQLQSKRVQKLEGEMVKEFQEVERLMQEHVEHLLREKSE